MVRQRTPPVTRAQARSTQRWRLIEAISSTVGHRGYARTTVADVIAAAGVSRRTFYEHFKEKEDCFLAAYDAMSERFARALAERGAALDDRRLRAAAQLKFYLEVLSRDIPMARAFIVEVLAAGPRALARREAVNRHFADTVFGYTSRAPVVRKAIIGGVNDVVAAELMRGGQGLLALWRPLTQFVQRASRAK